MTGRRACELCGSLDQRELYTVNGFPIVRCTDCGLVFVGTEPTDEELLALYDESYYEDPGETGYGGYGDAEERKRRHDRTLLNKLEQYVSPGRLLEIGCAYGFFLDEARKRGWTVSGVEPSAHAADYARKRLGLQVLNGAPGDLPTVPNSLDSIAMWDVIEHLAHPRETLAHAHAWLRPGGVIALSTGDVGSLSARLHGRDWSLMTPPWHQFFFSRATMRRLLREAGFEVVSMSGDGVLGIDPSSPHKRLPSSLTWMMQSTLVNRVTRRLGAGSIMFVYGRRVAG